MVDIDELIRITEQLDKITKNYILAVPYKNGCMGGEIKLDAEQTLVVVDGLVKNILNNTSLNKYDKDAFVLNTVKKILQEK